MSLVALFPLAILAAAPPAEGPAARERANAEGPAAREQARRCEERDGEEGLAACRRAIGLGLSAPRQEAVRELLARRLVALERWEELVEHYRKEAALHPESASLQLRLGSALLFGVDRPAEALAPLGEAARLAPDDSGVLVLLGIARNALDRQAEAVEAFEAARRLDPDILDRRPAAKAVYEAARSALRWP